MKFQCCHQRLLPYVDAVNEIDRDLELLGRLCSSATDPELTDPDTLQDLGRAIQIHLQKHRILRHFFFDERIPDFVDEALTKGELARLQHHSNSPDREEAEDDQES